MNNSDQNPFNQDTSDKQNSQQDNPFSESNQEHQQNQSAQSGDGNGSNVKPWLFGCGGCLLVFIILAVILGACAAGPIKEQIDNITNQTEDKSTEEKKTEENTTEESTTEESTTEESTTEEDKNDSSIESKTSNIGNSIDAIGTKVTVEKAEYVKPTSKYSKPNKGKVLKVYYKLENINNSSLIVGDTNFSVAADGQTVSKFYGMDDSNDGFSANLKPGEKESGYVYYDVPDADKFDVRLQLESSDKNYRMTWNIDKSDLK
ncbi:DUF4352 domain-containing protein [Mammaliicoccus stepanovicii]|uniref:RNA binding protein n=1 Tax=Mammaliicoccus stepanovicii TaxID=643214 RepID=A0A239ZW53_9STAP|nr:DUF4352 domain-containing protein [Mammaliicoccus stepanovicii]PNZ77426.1 hypothetical protein CD111_04465 [Mammaliicoccus stepanovicii]GGI39051.1 hypothetical protein GCM10010896_01450 [Mammaliicoccus stepanovicii]SNV75034.1 RNA binding protein [Mammaliicoccus stepanovicii]